MRYNVATLLHEPVGSTREHAVDGTILVDGRDEQVSGHLSFVRTRAGILVRADLALSVTEACARCLRELRIPLTVRFEEEYLPTIDILTGEAVTVPEGVEDPYRIDEHHELDISEAAAQYSQLSRPMAALCRDDCPGICPQCGQDLAEEPDHRCRQEPVDERWAKLLDFHVR